MAVNPTNADSCALNQRIPHCITILQTFLQLYWHDAHTTSTYFLTHCCKKICFALYTTVSRTHPQDTFPSTHLFTISSTRTCHGHIRKTRSHPNIYSKFHLIGTASLSAPVDSLRLDECYTAMCHQKHSHQQPGSKKSDTNHHPPRTTAHSPSNIMDPNQYTISFFQTELISHKVEAKLRCNEQCLAL